MAQLRAQQQRQILHFQVLDIDLCLDLPQVLKILPLAAWQAVPEGPPYLVGLLNIGGSCIPMIDLAARLGLGQTKLTLDTPMLWCQSGDTQAVLLIGNVSGVNDIVADDMRMQPLFNEGTAPYLAAVALPEGSALLLDMARLLDIKMMAEVKNTFVDPHTLLDKLQPPSA